MMNRDDSNDSLRRLQELAVLLAADDIDGAELCLQVLKRAKMNVRCDVVKTRLEFASRLHTGHYDVILYDQAFRDWSATDALALLQSEHRDIPFILITGALGDEKAVECIQKGMADYVLRDHLERLPLAIFRCVELRTTRGERKAAVGENEGSFRTILETVPAAVFMEGDARCCYVNRAAEDITGYNRDELLAMNFAQMLHEDCKEAVLEQVKRSSNDPRRESSESHAEIKLLTKSGEVRWLDVTVARLPISRNSAILIVAFDITDRKRAEQESAQRRDLLTGLATHTRMNEVFDIEAARSARTGRPFAVLLVALDGLKQIKVKYGHLVAQRALCRLARVMSVHSRSLDTAVRLTEDEFAFILPETGSEGAPVLGRRIAARLAKDPEQPALACRFVAAVYPDDGKTLEEALKAARHRLSTAIPGGVPVSTVYSS